MRTPIIYECTGCGVENFDFDLIIKTTEVYECKNCKTEIKIITEENIKNNKITSINPPIPKFTITMGPIAVPIIVPTAIKAILKDIALARSSSPIWTPPAGRTWLLQRLDPATVP